MPIRPGSLTIVVLTAATFQLAASAANSGSAAQPQQQQQQQQQRTTPVFVDGQAQPVPAFADTSTWVRERPWVETEFDTDGDARRDRMHVDVVRPGPTATEGQLPCVSAFLVVAFIVSAPRRIVVVSACAEAHHDDGDCRRQRGQ
jgi:hypothetical protein